MDWGEIAARLLEGKSQVTSASTLFPSWISILGLLLRVSPGLALCFGLGIKNVPQMAKNALYLLVVLTMLVAAPGFQSSIEQLPVDFAVGMRCAVGAAILPWALRTNGSLLDQLSGVGKESTPIHQATGYLAAVAFFSGPGISIWLQRLLTLEPRTDWLGVAKELNVGMLLSLSFALPWIVTSVLLEILLALFARSSRPAPVQSLLAPLRTLAMLAVTVFLVDFWSESWGLEF